MNNSKRNHACKAKMSHPNKIYIRKCTSCTSMSITRHIHNKIYIHLGLGWVKLSEPLAQGQPKLKSG